MPSQGEDVTFGTEGAGIGKHGYNEQVESKLAADKYAGWFDKKSEGQGGEYGDIKTQFLCLAQSVRHVARGPHGSR